MNTYNVIIMGCGIMGRRMAEALIPKKSFKIVGALDTDPELVGRDLGDLFDPPQNTGIKIESDASALFSRVEAEAAILTTQSHLKTVQPQINQIVEAGLNVISTCEELSFPWKRSPELARQIDALATEYGVTVVGTGINPGYLMDSLAIFLTAPCLSVDSIRITRMMNSAKRRIPFQAKVGTTMTPEEFRKKIDDGTITGHVGLLESINMIATGLGWELDETVELPPEAVIAEKDTPSGMGTVTAGNVIGLKSLAYATKQGEEVISLEFIANAGVTEEYDEIFIDGQPKIHERIIGGVHGDVGTVAVTINTVPNTIKASPGLKLMNELPAPAATP
ncbi:dihydrodipicolinate reductase [Acidobacteriota bacterium]